MNRGTLLAVVAAVGAGALGGAWFSTTIREKEPQAQAAGAEQATAVAPSTLALPFEPAEAVAIEPVPAPPPAVGAPAPARQQASSRPAGRPAAPPARVERIDDDDWSADEEQREAERAAAERRAREEAERVNLAPGTELSLVLETGLSSTTSQPGDAVTARVERATGEDGRILLPGGTVLKGRVTEARSAGRVSGRSYLAVAFDQIVVRGRTHALSTTQIAVEGEKGVKRDAAMVGGSAAVGAIIGGIADGGSGAKKGALIGGAMGTGAVLATRGKEVELPAGSRWTVTVRDGVR
jgi:hypothetical protein